MLFFKKINAVSSGKKEACSLPGKKIVQFEPDTSNLKELEQSLKDDLRNTLTRSLPPANYYRDKKKWLNCELYFNDDYSSVYVRLVLLSNDIPAGNTDFYKIDYEIMRDLLRRFGQYI